MRENEVDEILEEFNEENLEEMASQGTKTRTDIWIFRREIVKDKILEKKEKVFRQVQEIEIKRKELIDEFNVLAKAFETVDKEIGSVIRGKRKDIEERREEERIKEVEKKQ